LCLSDLKLRNLADLWSFNNWQSHSKTSNNYIWCHFYDVIKITTSKTCHLKYVTKFFIFKPLKVTV